MTKKLEWLVLADDATGALDTGVQFVNIGYSTYVVTGCIANADESAQVLVINTASRHDEPKAAAEKVRTAIGRYPAKRLYKKTDSVLRGNISSEIAALHNAVGAPVCFVPFYPAQRRSTRGGVQYVDGVRVDHSSFASDPANPVTQADISALLGTYGLSSEAIPHPYPLPAVMPDVLIFDGETEENMATAVRVIEANGLLAAVAGCAGFAAHVPPPEKSVDVRQETIALSPLLIVSGSVASATLAQIDAAQAHGTAVVQPTRDALLGIEPVDPYLERCMEELSNGRSVVFASATSASPLFQDLPDGLLQRRFSQWTSALIEQMDLRTLMIIGGDLLMEFLRTRNIGALRPIREMQPGLPLCEAESCRILSKSGGFGHMNTLIDIIRGEIS